MLRRSVFGIIIQGNQADAIKNSLQMVKSLQMVFQSTDELSICFNGKHRKAPWRVATFTKGTIAEDVLTILISLCVLNMSEQKTNYDHSLDVEAGKWFP